MSNSTILRRKFPFSTLAFVTVFMMAAVSVAQTEKTIYVFQGDPDGSQSRSGLVADKVAIFTALP